MFLLLLIFIVFKTNHNLSCNGILDSHSFRQACAIGNEGSRNEFPLTKHSISLATHARGPCFTIDWKPVVVPKLFVLIGLLSFNCIYPTVFVKTTEAYPLL